MNDMLISKMKDIIIEIEKHNYNYYNMDTPTIADVEYDKLYDSLLQLEKESGVVLENSPTHRVGSSIRSEFKEYYHKNRLYSLDKCKNKEDLKVWYDKIVKQVGYKPELTLEYKYDGLTLNLTYEDGKLISAATRGDGIKGETVTDQVKTIKTAPLAVKAKEYFEVQGEGIMRLSALKDYNEDNAEDVLKNARNAVAGAIRNIDSRVTAKRKLDFFAYDIGFSEDGLHFTSQKAMHEFLIDNGFYTGSFFLVCLDIEQVIAELDNIEATRDTLDYLIDGAVVKICDKEIREDIGYTEKFPKWAIAYKFKAEEATTTVLDVEFSVSRTGKINPVAILEPVDIGGATISRATLNNLSEIEKKDIRINSRVFIRRSNDVIPEILGVAEHTENSRKVVFPSVCPVCGSEVIMNNAFLYCINKESCAMQIISKLTHFCSKGAMDIEGLSDKTIEQLYYELSVKKYSDIFAIQVDSLLKLESFKDKKSSNIFENIQKSKNTTLSRFIFAIGIPNIGKKSALQLADKYSSLTAIMSAQKEDILTIKDFGDIMADSLIAFFSNENNVLEINALLSCGINFSENTKRDGALSGLNIVVTGSLMKMKRSQIESLITDNGGNVSSAIGKNTDFLVAGSSAGSKLEKAQKLGITVITEDEFFAKYFKNGEETY